MFAQRFDPAAFLSQDKDDSSDENTRKRKLSQTSISSDDDDSSSDEEVKSGKSDTIKHSETSDSSDYNDSSDSSDSSDTSDSSDSSDSSNSSESESDDESVSDETEIVQNEIEIVKNESNSMDIVNDEDFGTKEDAEDNMILDSEETTTSKIPFETVENDPKYISKHLAIFQKFQNVIPSDKKSEEDIESDHEIEDDQDQIEQQGLTPLPQPTLPRDKRLSSNSAHLKSLDWLAKPIFSSPELMKPFVDFKLLSPFMLQNLKSLGFSNAFSVQISVLDILLKDIQKNKLQPDFKGDLLVNASTGSGKTLAYSIPIIEALHQRVIPRVRAIILVPTKPLISQVKTTLLQLSKGTNLSIVNLKNETSIKEEGSKLRQNEPDIIISTPGRLVEHLTNGSIDLRYLRFLVIDEADRLLNQSFQNWCQILISSIEKHSHQENKSITNTWHLKPQKLIFSATLTTDAGKLSLLKFEKPRLVIVNHQEQLVNEIFSVPPTLSEFSLTFGSAKSSIKPLILSKFLISQNKMSNVLIFTKSNDSSLRLSKLMSLLFEKLLSTQTVNIMHINSTNNTSAVRTKILKDFSSQSINILVATDLIARGIDISSITDVINYDLPNSSREYVHRVGRTARANQDGHAYSFCFGKGESKWFKTIMKDVGRGAKSVEAIEVDSKSLINDDDEKSYGESLTELQNQVHQKS